MFGAPHASYAYQIEPERIVGPIKTDMDKSDIVGGAAHWVDTNVTGLEKSGKAMDGRPQ